MASITIFLTAADRARIMKKYDEHAIIRKVEKRRIKFTHTTFRYKENNFDSEYKMAEWIDRNTTGEFGVEFLKIGFADKADAMIYRLHFG